MKALTPADALVKSFAALSAIITMAGCQSLSIDATTDDAFTAAASSTQAAPLVEQSGDLENKPDDSSATVRVDDYQVATTRTVFTTANSRGDDPGPNGGRATLLNQGTKVRVLSPSPGRRSKVRLEDGRVGFVFSSDIEPIPVTTAIVSVPVLDESDAPPAFPVSPLPRPAGPVDSALLREANQLEMPVQ